MSKVYAVVGNNGILAAFPYEDEARNYLEYTVSDRDDAMDCCSHPRDSDWYYAAKSSDTYISSNVYVRLEDDFLSLVTLTYINRSK
jgi:hypothetical protein